MRIALDPVPLVLGIYAHVGEVLGRAAGKREDGDATTVAKRYTRQRREQADRDIQKLVRALHSEVKTADKLLKKTGDVWKISQETDLVELVVQRRGEADDPRSYVLLKPAEIRAVLAAIRDAAKGAGEDDAVVAELEKAVEAIEGRPSDYLTFGFDPWGE
jgi:hypothetical protein